MTCLLRPLIVLCLALVPPASSLGPLHVPGDTQFKAEIEALEKLYQAAMRHGFESDESLQKLEERAEAFIEAWEGEAPPAVLATARTYRVRCWLSEEKYEDAFAETTTVLETEGLKNEDRRKLLYYRAVSAIETDRRDAAEAAVEALHELEPGLAASVLGMIVRKWNPVEPGKEPPAWTLHRLPDKDGEPGEPLSLSALRGKYVLLDFWATWCGPCRVVMKKELAPLHKQWGDDGRFEIVSVGTNWNRDTAEKQAKFAREESYKWTKVYDADGRVTASYGVEGIPTLTFIGPDGKVIAHGYSRQVLPKVKETLAELKERQPSS